MDQRLSQLQQWLGQIGISGYQIAPASADASFRRYFRIQWDGESRIVMDAPPEKENCQPFIAVATMLFDVGLHVPQILAHDLKQGFILLSDLGSKVYLSELGAHNVDHLYGDALKALLIMQTRGSHQLPAYDEALLRTEMSLFPDWYLVQHLQIQLTRDQQQMLKNTFDLLVENALQQPRVCVHRDYHSRNLMISEPNPGILDFQDAVHGPITYDLVSLLKDCYIKWPRKQIEGWVNSYYQMLRDSGLLSTISAEQFLRWFDWMGVQRHLKATGIFARLNYRDGKPGYLGDIPRTMSYMHDVASDYAELGEFRQFLEQIIEQYEQNTRSFLVV